MEVAGSPNRGRTIPQPTHLLKKQNLWQNVSTNDTTPKPSKHLKTEREARPPGVTISKKNIQRDPWRRSLKEVHLETKASINFKQNPFQSSSISINTRSVSQMLLHLSSGDSKCQGTRLLANDPDWDMPRGQVQRVCLPDHIPCTPGTPNSAIREEVQRECLSWLSNEGPRSKKLSF